MLNNHQSQGKISDKFGRRKVIVAATEFFIAGAIICGGAINLWILLFGRILLGIAIGNWKFQKTFCYKENLRSEILLTANIISIE